jgi:dihydroorotase
MGAVFGDALSAERWVELASSNPRKLMKLSQPVIKEGEVANVTLFEPLATYVFTDDAIRSKSKNSAFVGKELKGKVIGIINNNQLKLN